MSEKTQLSLVVIATLAVIWGVKEIVNVIEPGARTWAGLAFGIATLCSLLAVIRR